jgi:hypothetical protein
MRTSKPTHNYLLVYVLHLDFMEKKWLMRCAVATAATTLSLASSLKVNITDNMVAIHCNLININAIRSLDSFLSPYIIRKCINFLPAGCAVYKI